MNKSMVNYSIKNNNINRKRLKRKGKTMSITNKVMLITYPDSLGKNIHELSEVLATDLKGDRFFNRKTCYRAHTTGRIHSQADSPYL